jgi:hypothetical protein
MQKMILKSGENCSFESKNTKKEGFRRHFGCCGHFVELLNLWLNFSGASLDYQ